MGHTWNLKPQIKITVNDAEEEIQKHCIDADIYLIENAISRLHLTANNSKGRQYLRRIRPLDTINAYLRYDDGDWQHRFGGTIEKLAPIMSPTAGYSLQAVAYGYGRALRNTHCIVDYGTESENSGFDTPSEIIDDIRTDRVNKNFDGAATGYSILGGNILTMNNPSIQYLKGGYRKNIDILNEVLLMYQAYRAGSSGVHWRVDPDRYLWVDQIGNHTVNQYNWPTYWKRSQTASLLTQKKDILDAQFSNDLTGYANKILLCTDLRNPSYDYWTEDSGGSALWGNSGLTSITDDNTANYFVVGSHSLKLLQNGGAPGIAYLPSTEDAGWDITTVGSEENAPTINFYFRRNTHIYTPTTYIRMFTTDNTTDYFYCAFLTGDPVDTWIHRSIPIGPYWKSKEYSGPSWAASSVNADWSNINGIAFYTLNGAPVGNGELHIDDLHIAGKLVREAKNSTHIALYNEAQKIIHMDTAVNDSMKAADDSGTAAMLAYAELLSCQAQPTRGTITTPIITDILPGQFVAVKHDWRYGTKYGIDEDFRVQQVHHHFGAKPATNLILTNDLVNTFAVGPNEALSALAKALFYDPEAKSLKTTGIDTLVERLSIDYP